MLSLLSKIESMEQEVRRLKLLISEFPDIKTHKGRWLDRYVSTSLNDKPEKLHTCHSCGCCDNASLDIYFYVDRYREEANGVRVYTNPPYVTIGEKNPDYGVLDDEPEDYIYSDYKERIVKALGEAALALFEKEYKVQPNQLKECCK